MQRARKAIVAGLFLTIAAGMIPSSSLPAYTQPVSPPVTLQVPPAVQEQVEAALTEGSGTVEVNLQVETPAKMQSLIQAVKAAGGQALQQDGTILTAALPAEAAESIAREAGVVAMGANVAVSLEQAQIAATQQALSPADASRGLLPNLKAIGATDFRATQSAQGNGVVVAVIDTGIDPGHPALRQTSSGASKVIDWKDFTAEGLVETKQTVSWDGPLTASDGRVYELPAAPPGRRPARFGFWEEFTVAGEINRDLDRNGSQTDRFGVLLVDSTGAGQYDTVYVDTNNDTDFTDESPLRLFRESQTVGQMGRVRVMPLSARRLNFVVAELDAGGGYVRLGFDGNGHGTQVAGILGGNSADGFAGVAPGVQIMAIKALASTGGGDWFTIKQAIRYAAANGASIINMSIGGLAAAASKFDSTASEWLNQITREYGVMIILAADNKGPGLSSGTTLGNPSEVMAVGAYYSPEMWQRDFGYVVPHESIWALSGMGPRSDGSYLPNVVAPGGSPTTSPAWLDPTGYTTKVGTSIATPHVSGAAALLMEAGRREGDHYDRLSVRRALELGARPIAGFGVYEQGYGLIALPAAFSNLRQIDFVPALQARSAEGNGGFLARSYVPGNTEFWLTNLGKETTRVGIFSSADWVRPTVTSLTIGADTPRRLPLQIAAPETMGVHSAFLMITHHDKYGPSLTVPITYVRPIELPPSMDKGYSTTDTLEVGRYERYFFQVNPGAGSFNVTTRVPLNAQGIARGTVQVHLFRPDGRAVYSGEIGARSSGLTARVGVDTPVSGVWEVVVTSLPDSAGEYMESAFTLDAQVRPGLVSGQPLRFNVASGATLTQSLRLTNPVGGFTGHLEGMGVVAYNYKDPWNLGLPWRVEEQGQSLIEDFTLRQFVPRMQVEVNNVVPAGSGLKLYLYYLDAVRGWQLRGEALTDQNGRAVIEVENLPSGRYQTLAVVNGGSPGSTQFQYRRLLAIEGYQVIVNDPVRYRIQGAIWNADLTIKAPYTPGRYVGYLLLRDTENNKTLSWVPFELSVGQPALSIQPLVAELVRGQASTVVLEIREAAASKPVDATISVNGRRFSSQNGRVVVPVTPAGDKQVLDIEANVPAYQFLKTQVVLPVLDAWGSHPLGVDPPEEGSSWRRKVINEIP